MINLVLGPWHFPSFPAWRILFPSLLVPPSLQPPLLPSSSGREEIEKLDGSLGEGERILPSALPLLAVAREMGGGGQTGVRTNFQGTKKEGKAWVLGSLLN